MPPSHQAKKAAAPTLHTLRGARLAMKPEASPAGNGGAAAPAGGRAAGGGEAGMPSAVLAAFADDPVPLKEADKQVGCSLSRDVPAVRARLHT